MSLFREISDHRLENAKPQKSQKPKSTGGGELGHFLEYQSQRLAQIEVWKISTIYY